MVDLGSGDGRIVLEAARRGFEAHGIELNLWLVLYSRAAAWRERGSLLGSASFSRRDLWKTDLAEFDDVVIFGGGDLVDIDHTISGKHSESYFIFQMEDLEKKLSEDLLPADKENPHRVVACRFPVPGWRASATVGSGIDTVWLYETTKL